MRACVYIYTCVCVREASFAALHLFYVAAGAAARASFRLGEFSGGTAACPRFFFARFSSLSLPLPFAFFLCAVRSRAA